MSPVVVWRLSRGGSWVFSKYPHPDSSFDLITPPSSPRGRSLELSDESDTFSFESASPLLPTLFDEPSQEWDQSSIEVASLEDGDWDEPLFLNAPSADCESGDLLVNLPVNGASLEDIEHERWLSEQCSQSSLDSSSSDPPLIHPSYFDVFKNEWDAIPSRTSRIHAQQCTINRQFWSSSALNSYICTKFNQSSRAFPI